MMNHGHRSVTRPDHALRNSALRAVHREMSNDGHGQGPEIRGAGNDDEGTGGGLTALTGCLPETGGQLVRPLLMWTP